MPSPEPWIQAGVLLVEFSPVDNEEDERSKYPAFEPSINGLVSLSRMSRIVMSMVLVALSRNENRDISFEIIDEIRISTELISVENCTAALHCRSGNEIALSSNGFNAKTNKKLIWVPGANFPMRE